MTSLKLENVCKSFGAVDVLRNVNLDIKSGEFVVFVGPSGCGKSTLLRIISGLEDITSGTLSFEDEVVNKLTPSQRGIAMVFQSYALYPHMTVYDNMAFGMKLQGGQGKAEIDKRVREAAAILQVDQYLDRLPKQLSGGQRQRVAIGRAIVRDPSVFLFDEPLSNLDAALRVQTRIEIARLHETMADTTMIYVTHDQVEAMTLADRIVVLRDGVVEQVGSPMELYHRPTNLFVAQFIGSPAMNILDGVASSNGASVMIPRPSSDPLALDLKDSSGRLDKVQLGVRPEDLVVADGQTSLFEGTISYLEQLGEVQHAYVDLAAHSKPLIAKLPSDAQLSRGETIHLTAATDNLKLFDADGKAVAFAA
ncbi:MAG: sn-glycerol-3-phosphate ABC transporter ATP-binding protein UgpC [Pseudomonadota bacterium]